MGLPYYTHRTLPLEGHPLTLGGVKNRVESTVIEQRKNQRFDLKLPFEILRSGVTTRTTGETKNVSSSGVAFVAAAPIEVGEPIEYQITLVKAPAPRSEVRLRCVGKVVRGDGEATFAATLERYEFVRGRS